MENLRECPFCGGKPKMYSDKEPDMHGVIHLCSGYDEYMVKIESRLFNTEEQAIAAWNTRYTPTPEPLSLEKLQQMDGEPVWIEWIGEMTCPSQWAVYSKQFNCCSNKEWEFYIGDGDFIEYGNDWLAYATKTAGEG